MIPTLHPACATRFQPDVENQLETLRMLARLKLVEKEAAELRKTLGLPQMVEGKST